MKYRLDRLGLFLHMAGKTQQQLASEIGVTKQTIGKYVNGKINKKIDVMIFKAICEYFDVPEKVFLEEEVFIKIKGDKVIVL